MGLLSPPGGVRGALNPRTPGATSGASGEAGGARRAPPPAPGTPPIGGLPGAGSPSCLAGPVGFLGDAVGSLGWFREVAGGPLRGANVCILKLVGDPKGPQRDPSGHALRACPPGVPSGLFTLPGGGGGGGEAFGLV